MAGVIFLNDLASVSTIAELIESKTILSHLDGNYARELYSTRSNLNLGALFQGVNSSAIADK